MHTMKKHDIQAIFKMIFKSGLDNDKLGNQRHYYTYLGTPKKEADVKRRITKLTQAVDDIIDHKKEKQNLMVYDETFPPLLDIAQKHDAPEIYSSLACCEYLVDRPDSAFSLFEKSISSYQNKLSSLDKNSVEYKLCSGDISRNLAVMLAIGHISNLKKGKSCLKPFLNSITTEPYSIDILKEVSKMFLFGYNPKVATILYQKLNELKPNDEEILKNLATCYEPAEEYSKIKKIYTKLKQAHPNDAEILSSWIMACILDKSDLNAAMAENEALRSKQPAKFYSNLYQIYEALNQPEQALKTLEEGVAAGFENELSFEFASYYFDHAEFDSEHSYYDKAIKYFEKSKSSNSLAPNIADMNIAIAYQCKHDYKTALNKMLEIFSYDHLPTIAQYESAMVTILYCFSLDLANIADRSRAEEFETLSQKYISIIDKFEDDLTSIINVNSTTVFATLMAINDTRNIFLANPNPSYFLTKNKHSAPTNEKLTLENLATVFDNWSKEPFIAHFLTKTELKRLHNDIETAIKFGSDPDYSFAGCLVNLHQCIEKYLEPLYNTYLMDRIEVLETKAKRYEALTESIQKELLEKINQRDKLRKTSHTVPAELYQEIVNLKKEALRKTHKYERVEKRLKEFVGISNNNFRLTDLYYLAMIFSTPKEINVDKDPDEDVAIEERPKANKIINPSFSKFLQMHYKQNEDESNPQIMALALLNNIERYRIIRNETVHFADNREYAEFSARGTIGKETLNWNHLADTHTATLDDFLTSLNLAMFSRYSILNLLANNLAVLESTADKTKAFFDENSSSARTSSEQAK